MQPLETLIKQQRWPEALAQARQTHAADPDNRKVREILAELLTMLGEPKEALRHLQLLLFTQGKDAELHRKTAQVHLQLDDSRTAERHLRQAVTLDPQSWASWLALGRLQQEQHRADEALETLNQGRQVSPMTAPFDNAMGLAWMLKGELDRAIEAFRLALQAEPHADYIVVNLGDALRSQGALEEARTLYLEALQTTPNQPRLLAGYAQLTRFEDPQDPWIQQMQQQLQDPKLPQATAISLHFALGRALDQSKDYRNAFNHFEQANTIRYNSQGASNLPQHLNQIARIQSSFSHPATPLTPPPQAQAQPIFIVGLFRSGSTLTEQILCSHPQVGTIGEEAILPELTQQLPAQLGGHTPYPECMPQLSPDQARTLAENYLSQMASHAQQQPGMTHVVDKQLFNFLHIGLIAQLFPQATVIHCRRNLLDTCLSIYFQNFTHGMRFMQNLEEIGHYALGYQHLMQHWRNKLPITLHEVVYEELVADPTAQIPTLLEAAGLPWDEACLAPHLNRKRVQTASAQQVREPIHTRARNRWQRYEAHIAPLRKILAEV
uniref:Putative sulfotransferase domain family protein n=1 Tax=Magnetococcus massalia (strain MO-1) TaxID=451514 RepID=A0A1S7LMA8_MAGMO|nr:putative sulfotransferase domain family protein [Candidatus Magnetococcus massalia]